MLRQNRIENERKAENPVCPVGRMSACRMGDTASAGLGRGVCTVRISGGFGSALFILQAAALRCGRPVHLPQSHRAVPLPAMDTSPTHTLSIKATTAAEEKRRRKRKKRKEKEEKKKKWKQILLNEAEYLLWIYVWFYLAWGLNYSQKDFYGRTSIPYTAYTPEVFQQFVDDYIEQLNASYTNITAIDEPLVCRESVQGYRQICDTLGIHRPPRLSPRVKTMLFTPFISMVGVTGSMGPFFCEFTLNGDLLPSQYPATYAHELAHLLGITSEAEANFYAYQVCTRSQVQAIRFSGYLSILSHVLGNARQLMEEEEYTVLTDRIRPEIKTLYAQNRAYWLEKYSPLIGSIQDFIYDLYLKGNRIQSGRKNYSEVIGLLISYEEAKRRGYRISKNLPD